MHVSLRCAVLSAITVFFVISPVVIMVQLIVGFVGPIFPRGLMIMSDQLASTFHSNTSASTFTCVESRAALLGRVLERRYREQPAAAATAAPFATAARDDLFSEMTNIFSAAHGRGAGARYSARFFDGTVVAAVTPMLLPEKTATVAAAATVAVAKNALLKMAVYKSTGVPDINGRDTIISGSAFSLVVDPSLSSVSAASSSSSSSAGVSTTAAALSADGLLQTTETAVRGNLWQQFFSPTSSSSTAGALWDDATAPRDNKTLRYVNPVRIAGSSGGSLTAASAGPPLALVTAHLPVAELQRRFHAVADDYTQLRAATKFTKVDSAVLMTEHFVLDAFGKRVVAAYSRAPSVSEGALLPPTSWSQWSYFQDEEVQKILSDIVFNPDKEDAQIRGPFSIGRASATSSMPNYDLCCSSVVSPTERTSNGTAAPSRAAQRRFRLVTVVSSENIFTLSAVAPTVVIFFALWAVALLIVALVLTVVTRSVGKFAEKMEDPWEIVQQREDQRVFAKAQKDKLLLEMESSATLSAKSSSSSSSPQSPATPNGAFAAADVSGGSSPAVRSPAAASPPSSPKSAAAASAGGASGGGSSVCGWCVDKLNNWLPDFQELETLERELVEFGGMIRSLRGFMAPQDFLGSSGAGAPDGRDEPGNNSASASGSSSFPSVSSISSRDGEQAEMAATVAEAEAMAATGRGTATARAAHQVQEKSLSSSNEGIPCVTGPANNSDGSSSGAGGDEQQQSTSEKKKSQRVRRGVTFAETVETTEYDVDRGSDDAAAADQQSVASSTNALVPFSSPVSENKSSGNNPSEEQAGGEGGTSPPPVPSSLASTSEGGAAPAAGSSSSDTESEDQQEQQQKQLQQDAPERKRRMRKLRKVASPQAPPPGDVPFVGLSICINACNGVHHDVAEMMLADAAATAAATAAAGKRPSQSDNNKRDPAAAAGAVIGQFFTRRLILRCNIVATSIQNLVFSTGAAMIEFRGDHALLAVRMRSDKRRSVLASRFILQLMKEARTIESELRKATTALREELALLSPPSSSTASTSSSGRTTDESAIPRVRRLSKTSEDNAAAEAATAASFGASVRLDDSELSVEDAGIRHINATRLPRCMNVLTAGVSVGYMRSVVMPQDSARHGGAGGSAGNDGAPLRSVSFVGGCFTYSLRLERFIRLHPELEREMQSVCEANSAFTRSFAPSSVPKSPSSLRRAGSRGGLFDGISNDSSTRSDLQLPHAIAVESVQALAFYSPQHIPIGDMPLPVRRRSGNVKGVSVSRLISLRSKTSVLGSSAYSTNPASPPSAPM